MQKSKPKLKNLKTKNKYNNKQGKCGELSVVILTKNSEKKIKDCLKSVKWVDEIVIVDSGSRDKTLEMANKFEKVKIYKRELNDFSSQRNFGMSKTNGEFILFLDSDEMVSEELKNEIKSLLNSDEILNHVQDDVENVVFRIRREDVFMGRKIKYGETGNAQFVRLVKKGSGKWEGKVHEEFVLRHTSTKLSDQAQESKSIGGLKGKIIHNHEISIGQYFDRINFYSDLRAEELKENGIKEGFLKIFMWPMGKFVYNYFFKLGILDGMAGFVLTWMMSMHSFLVRVKLRHLWEEEKLKTQSSKIKNKESNRFG